MIYKTLILPIMEYGDIIYDCLSAKDAATLQKLQNSCLKHVSQLPRLTSTAYIHATLDVEYLSVRCKQHVATQMFRVNNGMVPDQIERRFKDWATISERTTRSSVGNNYEIPKTKLEMTKRKFVYRGSKIWYLVPNDLKVVSNLKSF